MIKKILVPVAFSQYSQGILEHAADLAGPIGAELIVVNVINERDLAAVNRVASFGYKVDSDKYVEIIQTERREKITQLLEQLTLPDEKVSFSFCVGDPTSELLKVIVEADIDMVVMGIRDNDISSIFAGSVAERLFRKCPVPLLSIRAGDIAKRLRKRVSKNLG